MKQIRNVNYVPVLVMILLTLPLKVSQVYADVYVTGTNQIQATLVPDKSSIMLGEPTYLSFVVHNNSDTDLQTPQTGIGSFLGGPLTFIVTVTGQNGESVPQPNTELNLDGLKLEYYLPAKGNLTFRLLLPAWATFNETGTYTIAIEKYLPIGTKSSPSEPWKQLPEVKLQARADIQVIPHDTENMGKIISTLGDVTLKGERIKSWHTAYELAYIHDARVIPYFVKAFKTIDDDRLSWALPALATFNDKTAFQILKIAMEIQGKDITYAKKPELATKAAENIRYVAAYDLSKSPYPDAIPFLLSKRKDNYARIRLIIVNAASKLKPEKAIPILQEMSNDKDKQVSDKAKQYLKLLSVRTTDGSKPHALVTVNKSTFLNPYPN
ncbi:MAG: HEAT repeat domain-containing protein, partial [Abditibacteriaceae bacterium]